MMSFHPASDRQAAPPDFKGSTLVLPAISVANVGQLALDLLITTCGSPDTQVTWMTHQFCPALAMAPSTLLMNGISPFAWKGQKRAFVRRLVAWIKQAGFERVLLLTGVDATRRADAQLEGGQLRQLSTAPPVATASTGSEPATMIPRLEETGAAGGPLVPHGSAAMVLYRVCEAEGVNATLLCRFCLEGDNVPEAMSLAEAAARWLGLPIAGNWRAPRSWAHIQGPPPDDTMY
eukprot:jgi/Chlat1/9198/Chrsp97S08468